MLKSDYFRIEMANVSIANACKDELKSDYFRIEIPAIIIKIQ